MCIYMYISLSVSPAFRECRGARIIKIIEIIEVTEILHREIHDVIFQYFV